MMDDEQAAARRRAWEVKGENDRPAALMRQMYL
jgi:hypothetical protein